MEKITFLAPLPDSGKSHDTSITKVKKKNEPSAVSIKNILNYSKALKVQECKGELGFIEYIAN